MGAEGLFSSAWWEDRNNFPFDEENSAGIFLFKVKNGDTRTCTNLFKVNNKDIRTT